jgi:Zn-dependent protease with chaperone function
VDLGVLLSVPLESVLVRAVIASLAAVMIARVLLRSGLRCPQVRVIAAIAPLLALVAVVLLSGTQLRLPTLMLPAEGSNALSIPVRDGYLHFMPIAAPVLVGAWSAIAAVRLVRRGLIVSRVRREALAAVTGGGPTPDRLVRLARSVAAAMEVPAPEVGVVDRCRGGAYVVGTRRPLLVVDRQLVARLDDEELEGVLAHELAHVRRRDTPVAQLLGIVRDLMFFVPGGGWAVQQLHRERELAADQLAVRITRRPGALASGLLKVLDEAPSGTAPCAALAPNGSVVDRVKILIDESPSPTPLRRGSETATVAVVAVVSVLGALVLPTVFTGAEREREAVALVWSAAPPAPAADVPAGEPRAFDTYRRTALEVAPTTVRVYGRLAEHSQDNRRAALHACADLETGCPVPRSTPSLGLRPAAITFDDAVLERWEATPMGNFESPDGFRVFWLANQAK